MVVHLLKRLAQVAPGTGRALIPGLVPLTRRKEPLFLFCFLLAAGLIGCPPPGPRPMSERVQPRSTRPGRDQAVARVETGRLKEEDLGLEPQPAAPEPDQILIPPELSRSQPERAAALRLTEQARELLASEGDTKRAVVLLEQAIGLDSHTPYAYYFLGEAHFRLGSTERALGFLERAAGLLLASPYWASRVWGLRGLIWESTGQRERALAAYRQALELWPENLTAVSGRARLGPPGGE